MSRRLVFGAFEEFTPSFISNGWPHADSDPRDYGTLGYWQRLAREVEAGGFDFLFFADAIGYPMVGDGIPDVVVREAVQFPVHDPMTLLPALAATVPRIGLVATASTTADSPFLLARRFASLDTLADGRVGWNVVTSDLQTALVRLLGQRGITPHDERYDRADEFVDLVLELWEGGWSDDAIVADKRSRTFTDPAKVHRIRHAGRYFDFDGLFPVAPSPQRTPTLFQAGASPRGRRFAGRIAEVVFIQERDAEKAAATVADLRAQAAAQGRSGSDLTIVNSISIVVGDTDAEARELRASLTAAPSREAMAALFLGWSGVNLLGLDPATPIDSLTTEVGQTTLASLQGRGYETVGAALDALTAALGGPKITGTPDAAAQAVADLAARTGVDGFLIEHSFGGLATYRRVIQDVLPRLRAMGLLPGHPRRGTLREMLTGADSPRLRPTHPGASYRR
jgi:long-chain alkane monooxygenase